MVGHFVGRQRQILTSPHRRGSRSGAALLAFALALVPAAAPAQPPVTLLEGDLIVLDILDDLVLRVDPDSGAATTLTDLLLSPRGAAVSPEGLLYVADTASDVLVRIDPSDGAAALIHSFTGSAFPEPAAVVLDPDNFDVLIVKADTRTILRVDPVTTEATVEIAVIGSRFPVGLARDPIDGTLVVADRFADLLGELAGLYRLDVPNATQSTIALSEDFDSLRHVAVQSDGDILVTDRGFGGSGAAVYCIPNAAALPTTCAPEPGKVAGVFNASFTGPNGIAVESDDKVIVSDFSAGTLYRLDADGGSRQEINVTPPLNGPYTVVVVPELVSRKSSQFLISEGGSRTIWKVDSAAIPPTPARVAIEGDVFAVEPRAMDFLDPANPSLTAGEIVVVDGPSALVRRNLATGANVTISSGGNFTNLTDVAVEADGQILVTDGDGKLIRVDPASQSQTLLSSALGEPVSLLIDANGSAIILDAAPLGVGSEGLYRLNPLDDTLGEFEVLDAGTGEPIAPLVNPLGLARDANGDVYVVERGEGDETAPSRILRLRGSDGPTLVASAFPYPNALNGALGTTAGEAATARAVLVDGNRDPIVLFASAEPARLDGLTGADTTLAVGGAFAAATDILGTSKLPPGVPADADGDLVPDGFDNCPDDANSDQADANLDGMGDLCQINDLDSDGWPDAEDNCPTIANTDQADEDIDGGAGATDGVGDACDNCPNAVNPTQADFDFDGTGDHCEDSDGDGTGDDLDTCPGVSNAGQADGDNDDVGDLCDNCVTNFNTDQSDVNSDGEGDVCETGDTDGDGIPEDNDPDDGDPVGEHPCTGGAQIACDDNCVAAFNPTQSDGNSDGEGDACQSDDSDLDGIPTVGGTHPVCTGGATIACDDNCLDTFNPTQADANADGEGDACQTVDTDDDGWPDGEDLCPLDFDPDNGDVNGDGEGDACQSDDPDSDGWPTHQGSGTAPDNCPLYPNIGQEDFDADGIGDTCDNSDSDPVVDAVDNCAERANSNQCDTDRDGYGNVCDGDFNNAGSPRVSSSDFSVHFFPDFQAGTDSGVGTNMSCDGSPPVSAGDFSVFWFPQFLLGSPGPSGWSCRGEIPCPPAP